MKKQSKSSIFCDISLCSRFKYFLPTSWLCLAWPTLESWRSGRMFLRNVGWVLPGYAALYPRRQNSSWLPLWELQILRRNYWWRFCFAIVICIYIYIYIYIYAPFRFSLDWKENINFLMLINYLVAQSYYYYNYYNLQISILFWVVAFTVGWLAYSEAYIQKNGF
jgi:hypothetical protein